MDKPIAVCRAVEEVLMDRVIRAGLLATRETLIKWAFYKR